MLVEHFMIGLPHVDYMMRRAFIEVLGDAAAEAFWETYMDVYFDDTDFAQIKALGFNHVRLPFSYRHFESDLEPYRYIEKGFERVDHIIRLCKKHGLYVLLDLHSAPGCQASDWNAESANGEALLWDVKDFRDRMAAFWKETARRYRDESIVMGYEVLNEPVTLYPYQVALMNDFHHACINAIREEDPNHIIVLNGDKHATNLKALDDASFEDPQVMAAWHHYHQYTPPLSAVVDFPCEHDGEMIDEAFLIERAGFHTKDDRERIERPSFLDEFGAVFHGPTAAAQSRMIGAHIEECERHGIHWNLWHYKDVRGMGIMQMKNEAPWMGFLSGTGLREVREQYGKIQQTYIDAAADLTPMEGKRRWRLQAEAARDFQHQLLFNVVEQLKGKSISEMEILGASFASEHFEPIASIHSVLQNMVH